MLDFNKAEPQSGENDYTTIRPEDSEKSSEQLKQEFQEEDTDTRRKKIVAIQQVQKHITPDNIALFRLRFRGREDIVPVYWKSKRDDKSGYSPLCKNKWDLELCNLKKKKRGGCSNCKNADYTPWSDELVEHHIAGGSIYGVYPLLNDDFFVKSRFN